MTYALVTERMDEEERLDYDRWLEPGSIPLPEDPQPERPQPASGQAQQQQEAGLAAVAAAFAMEPASTMQQR